MRLAALAVAVASVLAAAAAAVRAASNQGERPRAATVPAKRPADPLPDGRYSYVAVDGGLRIYDTERNHRLVREVAFAPRHGVANVRGIAADARTDRLYLTYWGPSATREAGYLLAYDLRRHRVLWRRAYRPSIDSLALSRDGRKIYMPCGEELTTCDWWFVLDAATGDERRRIKMHHGAHNTIVSVTGDRAYLASLAHDRLAVVDTRTDRIVSWVGPFRDSIRPFTVNRAGTLVFVTVDFLSGFEIGSVRTRRRLRTVEVQGFPLAAGDFPTLPRTQTHGIALTPDETEVWIVDDVYRHLHVFDVRGVPGAPPRQIADIALRDHPKWINFTCDGRYAHVSTGEIVDRRTRRVVAHVAPSRQFVQIDWKGGEPVRAYSRYGLGYGDRP